MDIHADASKKMTNEWNENRHKCIIALYYNNSPKSCILKDLGGTWEDSLWELRKIDV